MKLKRFAKIEKSFIDAIKKKIEMFIFRNFNAK